MEHFSFRLIRVDPVRKNPNPNIKFAKIIPLQHLFLDIRVKGLEPKISALFMVWLRISVVLAYNFMCVCIKCYKRVVVFPTKQFNGLSWINYVSTG